MIRTPQPVRRRWRPASLGLIGCVWLVLYLGGLRSPGLLDDVDSVYTEVAREMLARHDFVTPTVDGIRFFDKPPLMYWMAAGSMHLFGPHDWAARLPLALGVLGLLLAVYGLGIRFYAANSPPHSPDRGGLYAALATGLCMGTYLYTRFYIPDILLALWMTLGVHLFLIAMERIEQGRSALWPSLGFAAVAAVNVLTKGLIGLVFPLGFVLLYLLWARRLSAVRELHLAASTAVFLLIAAPWHVLAALQNPAVPMPPGLGLPTRAGWAWFYLYNEHIARFLGRRIPHDYGQVPIPLFWLLLLLWLFPWAAFVPSAILHAVRVVRSSGRSLRVFDSDITLGSPLVSALAQRQRLEASRTTLLWPTLVLGFFTLGSRQEYYHLPALPALALMAGGLLAAADGIPEASTSGARGTDLVPRPRTAQRRASLASIWFLVPVSSLLCAFCGYLAWTAPRPAPGASLSTLLSSNPDLYNLSLGHVFDLTGRAMGLFRGPLTAVALGMAALGPASYLLRRVGRAFAANLAIAAGTAVVLLAAHEGLARFYPILGSKELAVTIEAQRQPGDLVALDGELTSGSTLLFYGHSPVLLVNGRVNGPWFGSFFPDAPRLFPTDADLLRLWTGQHRVFLLTYHPDQRISWLNQAAPVHILAQSGGKTVLSNR